MKFNFFSFSQQFSTYSFQNNHSLHRVRFSNLLMYLESSGGARGGGRSWRPPVPRGNPPGLRRSPAPPPPHQHLICIHLLLQPPFPASSCSVLWSRSILTQLKLRLQLFSPHFFVLKNVLVQSRAVDPHSFFADPDPAVLLNADPDPA